jgi:hypothetical protein
VGISIIIAHEKDEVLNTEYFVEQLKQKWADTKIHFITELNAPLLQFQASDNFRVLGDFAGTGISFRGNSDAAIVQFALWYRSIVPHDWELRIYDSALSFDFMFITNETTEEQLIAGFAVPFDASKYE